MPRTPSFGVSSRRVGIRATRNRPPRASKNRHLNDLATTTASSSQPPFNGLFNSTSSLTQSEPLLNSTRTVVILSEAQNPRILHFAFAFCICICILLFAFAFAVASSCVILNAVKDPEETTRPQRLGSFNPHLPPWPLSFRSPRACALASCLRPLPRAFASCRVPSPLRLSFRISVGLLALRKRHAT
jgi:hypothetical protein